MKRIFVLLMTLVMAVNCCFTNVIFAADENSNIAQAVLGNSVMQSGFDLIETGTNSSPTVVVRAGLESWMMDKSAGEAQSYIGFSLDEQFTGKTYPALCFGLLTESYIRLKKPAPLS